MSDERFQLPARDAMTPEQRRMADAIVAGPRGSLRGPFPVLIHSPVMGDIAQRLGAYVRFESVLPPKLRELAILTVARHWTAQYEWYAHRELAMKAGLAPAIADAIAAAGTPTGLDADEQAIYNFARELLTTSQVADATFAAVKERFGQQAVVDLVATMGYYSLVAMTLNVNRTALPPGAIPLPPLAMR
ncbi:MAG TPA: carboxymuconolactone decarboxylase family protein [Stellaceae bacterium]|jgi:4-carboxymuconolactone decarboxylase|nr:carboxymuconolactone decarboxylase family protein [Stellaceae bacterium]